MVSITMLVVLASAGGLLIIEPKAVDGQFSNGLWWAIVTATTVGYGDIAPTTPLARLLGLLVMITGIGLISTVAASVTAYFVEHDEGPDLRAIAARLDRIEGLLVRIQEQQNGAAKETGVAIANASADAQAGP
ncbi:MAG: potassium channel family protein [Bryobacteraceae bacterium]